MAITDIETVSEAFVAWLESQSIATFGTDLYLNNVPSSAPDAAYWLLTAGGTPIRTLATGEKVKQYSITVNYRSTSGKAVERNLFRLEELLNCAQCVQLEGFETMSAEATQFPSSQDLDNEDRQVGILQATIQIYKSC